MTDSSERSINTTKVVSGIVLLTLLAKLIGFFREIMLSSFFGATGVSDAYLISQNIPGTIFTFVGTGLMTSFIPVYYKVLEKDGKEQAVKFTNSLLIVILSFSAFIILLIWLCTKWIVKMFAIGFEGETLYYAIWFTRISSLSLFLSSLIYVFSSYLQANKIFTITAFAAIPNSLCIMIGIILGAKVNIWLLSIFSVISIAVQLLVLVPSIKKTGYSAKQYSPINFRDGYIKDFFSLLAPVIIGVSINQLNLLIDRTIASEVAIGGISALTYADSLIQFIQGGLVQPVATVYYPQITDAVSKGDYKHAVQIFKISLNMVLSILIPITVGLIVFSRPIISLLFMRGAFDEKAVDLTSTGVMFYAVGICFVAIREFLSRYFYADSDTRTPMINASIGVFINILMNLFLSRIMGISGLALATSVSAIVAVVLLWRIAIKKKKLDNKMISMTEICKILFCTAVSIASGYLVFTVLPFASAGCLICGLVVAVAVYTVLAWLLKMEIYQWTYEKIRNVSARFRSEGRR